MSVTSFDGSVFYEEGTDYIREDSRLILTEHSRIPILSRDIYCKPFTGVPETAWVRLPDGEHYMEVVSDVYRWQILVTYTHKTVWDSFSPVDSSSLLPQSMQKLQNGGDFHLVFYGDSITAGWEASGCNESAIDMVTLEDYHVTLWHAPYQPAWAELVSNSLQHRYTAKIYYKKRIGLPEAHRTVGVKMQKNWYVPAIRMLVILGFGMNSMQEPAEIYKTAILSIVQTIRSEHPDCEFLLVISYDSESGDTRLPA